MIFLSRDFYKSKFLLIVLAAIANLSMITIRPDDVLSEDDLILEASENTTPALSAPLNATRYWESFNQWKCFFTETVEAYCAEIDYGQSHLPTLRVSGDDGTLYELSLDPEPDLNCKHTLHQWRELLKNQRSFCTYTAYLQDIDDDHQLWIVDRIKSSQGSWSYRANIDDDSQDP